MKWFLTHGLIAAVAYFSARIISGDPHDEVKGHHRDHSARSQEAQAGMKNQGSAAGERRQKGVRPNRGEEFLTAWEALRNRELSLQDRITAQRRLLREWAKVDRRGAFRAALGEAWDPDLHLWGDQMAGPLAGAFSDVFLEDPQGTWDLIRSGEFGVGASLLRHAWCQAMVQKDPLTLCQKFPELGSNDIRRMIDSLHRFAFGMNEIRDQIGEALLSLPEEKVRVSDLLKFLPQRPMEEVREALGKMTDFESREARLLLARLSQTYRIDSLGTEGATSMDGLKSEIQKLPGEA